MKNLIYVLTLLVTFTACNKGDDPSPKPASTGNGLSQVPTTFSQKVLIETFTGAGQAQCTDGFVKLDNITSTNSTKSIPVCIHFGDGMEIAQYTTLTNAFSNGNPMTFPSAMLNRTASLSQVLLNRTQWQSNFDVSKVKSAKCGLAIETSVSGNNATIIAHCGFNQTLSGNYTLTTYLIEDHVTGIGAMYDQRNSYNNTSGHAYNGLGDPIIAFSHMHVLRKVLTSPLGDAINSSALVAGGKQILSYTTTISGYKLNDLYAISFITKNGSAATDYEIMNVQKVKIGNTQSWD